MKTIPVVACLLLTWFTSEPTAWAQQIGDSAGEIRQASIFITAAAKRLGVASVEPNWNDFLEVKRLRLSSNPKRIAHLSAALDQLEPSDAKLFANKENDAQAVASVITRVAALSNLKQLIAEPVILPNDAIVLDYIAGELADLKLVIWKKIPYGAYLQARENRDSKRLSLLMQDQEVTKEYLIARTAKTDPAATLANKTLLLSLMRTCGLTPTVCRGLEP